MALVNAQWDGKNFVLSEDDLVRLLESDMELTALECGGVDKWDYRGEACCDYLEEAGFSDFEDAARDEVATLRGAAAALCAHGVGRFFWAVGGVFFMVAPPPAPYLRVCCAPFLLRVVLL